MLRVIQQQFSGLRYSVYSSLALSFAGFGDAFLYAFLPQNAGTLGVPVVWIGFLLSINRFIRIAFNPLVTKLFEWYGIRQLTVAAATLAVISTAGYATGWGLVSLIVFRISWGMAFAVLRISSMAYALEHVYAGRSLGIGKSVQEAGPMLALWVAPLLLSYFSASYTFLFLAVISLPAIGYARALPGLKYVPSDQKRIVWRFPSLISMLTFLVSFLAEGILIIAAGLLIAKNYTNLNTVTITAIAAGYLAYRRICFIVFAPVSGMIADRAGFSTIFIFSLFMMTAGMILLLLGWIPAGLLLVFTFNSVNSTMAPGTASVNETDKIQAVAANATWRDTGAAVGTLLGGFLLSGNFLFEILVITTFSILVLTLIYIRKTKLS